MKWFFFIVVFIMTGVSLQADTFDVDAFTQGIQKENTQAETTLHETSKAIEEVKNVKESATSTGSLTAVTPVSVGNVESMRYYLAMVMILAVTALLSIWMILKYIKTSNKESLMRLVGIVIILFMAGFITITTNQQEQLTPIIGLLGAIAGYFLKEGKEMIETAINSEDSDDSETKTT
jgi:hypothetical protein